MRARRGAGVGGGVGSGDCVGDGACWAFVTSRIGQFVYGFYPEAERWRVNVAFALLAAGIGALMVPRVPRKGLIGVGMLTVYPAVAFVLIRHLDEIPVAPGLL